MKKKKEKKALVRIYIIFIIESKMYSIRRNFSHEYLNINHLSFSFFDSWDTYSIQSQN